MQLNWLRDFVELARTRSFTRAAENRHVTHPAFGRRIKALEEWAGVALVERTKPVELTADGLRLLETAVEIIERVCLLRDQLVRTGGEPKMEIRIITGNTVSMTFFPAWYQNICEHIGFFRVSLVTEVNDKAVAMLASQEADLLLAYSSHHVRLGMDPARFEWLTVGSERLVPVSKSDINGQPLYCGKTEKPDPVLGFASATALKMIFMRHIAEQNRRPNIQIVHESASYSSLLELVSAGLGLAWLPEGLVGPALKSGRLVMVDVPEWCINIDLVLYRRKFFRHSVADRVWAFCAGNKSAR